MHPVAHQQRSPQQGGKQRNQPYPGNPAFSSRPDVGLERDVLPGAVVAAVFRTCNGVGHVLLFFLGSSMSSLRSEEHTSGLQSLMRISYAVFCLKKKKIIT